MATTVAALNLPPASRASLELFFDDKIRRAISAAESPERNPSNMEDPWYEVYGLFLDKLLLSHPVFGAGPQGALTDVDRRNRRKIPDFIVYKYVDNFFNNTTIVHSRIPRLVIEIKKRLKRVSAQLLLQSFNSYEFLRQIRDQAKQVFVTNPQVNGVFLLQCAGRFWRRGFIPRIGTSPPHNIANTPVNNIQWSLIVDMMSVHAGAQIAVDLNNAPGNVFAP
jgi:hypothetical protein